MTPFGGVDPGRRSGVAIVSAGRIIVAVTLDGDDLARDVGSLRGLRVAIETPRAYPCSPVRAQDIVRLARRAQELATAIGPGATLVEPRTWKGTLDKKRHHAQLRARLWEGDRETFDRISEHARDAVGIALWLERTR